MSKQIYTRESIWSCINNFHAHHLEHSPYVSVFELLKQNFGFEIITGEKLIGKICWSWDWDNFENKVLGIVEEVEYIDEIHHYIFKVNGNWYDETMLAHLIDFSREQYSEDSVLFI